MTDLENHRYPIGRFERCTQPFDTVNRAGLIDAIGQTPAQYLRDRERHIPFPVTSSMVSDCGDASSEHIESTPPPR